MKSHDPNQDQQALLAFTFRSGLWFSQRLTPLKQSLCSNTFICVGGNFLGRVVTRLAKERSAFLRTLPSPLRFGMVLVATAVFFCRSEWSKVCAAEVVGAARQELRAAKLPADEIRVRLKIIENVAALKAYFPRADGGRPETRNPKFWKTNKDGSYIPIGKPTEAIGDLWRTVSGIRCSKLSALVMIKAMVDVADEKQLAALDEMLQGKVIPNGLPKRGVGTLFSKPKPKNGEVFQLAELLPGDEVWFENPYFDLIDSSQKPKYYGQEGHHVFYIGGGNVMDMYSREPQSIEDFRRTFLNWKSVKIAAETSKRKPRAGEFQIKAVRRLIFPKNNS